MKHFDPTRLVLAAVLAVGAAASAMAEDFYRGKTINCVVPYNPGGGTDTFYQTFAPAWSRNIPGNPEIVIQHMAGAGGLKGNNHVYEQAKNDGMTVLCAPWLSLAQILGTEGARFRYDEMELIGGQQSNRVLIVKKDAGGGINTAMDLIGSEEFILGGLSPTSSQDLGNRSSFAALGVENYKYVPGFRGGAKIRAAFERGEIHTVAGNMEQYAAILKGTLVDTGLGTPVWYNPSFDSNGNPVVNEQAKAYGIPSFVDVMHEAGRPLEGEAWETYKYIVEVTGTFGLSAWLPAGSPQEAVEALRAGWDATFEDAQFIEDSTKRFGAPMVKAELADALAIIENHIRNPDSAKVDLLQALVDSAPTN